jgi:hypothetical protein
MKRRGQAETALRWVGLYDPVSDRYRTDISASRFPLYSGSSSRRMSLAQSFTTREHWGRVR